MQKMQNKKIKIAEVFWYDTIVRMRHDSDELPLMKSIGYLYKIDKKKVSLLSLLTPNGDIEHGPSISIPRGCVKQIKYMRG